MSRNAEPLPVNAKGVNNSAATANESRLRLMMRPLAREKPFRILEGAFRRFVTFINASFLSLGRTEGCGVLDGNTQGWEACTLELWSRAETTGMDQGT